MNIFEAMFTCRMSQSDLVYGFKSLWETLTDAKERKLYIQRETQKHLNIIGTGPIFLRSNQWWPQFT